MSSLHVGEDFKITSVKALEIADSRGRPTVKVCVSTRMSRDCASAPSGASKGKYEAVELRDGGHRLRGYGVKKAVFSVEHQIAPILIGKDVRMQAEIDEAMKKLDGTRNLSKLGANATIATSIAVAKTAAKSLSLPLYKYIGGVKPLATPVPLMNILNGGAHAGNELEFQEFLIAPVKAETFTEAFWKGVEVYHSLKDVLEKEYGRQATLVGDEGGFAPPLRDPHDALEIITKAIEDSGYKPGEDFYLGIDVAATQFYDTGKKRYRFLGREWTSSELADYYLELVEGFPVKSIEDPFYEEHYKSFAELQEKVRPRGVIIVGDDLYVTNSELLEKGLENRSTLGVIVKPNQVGTLTDTIKFIEKAKRAGQKIILSHRSGETEDNYVADLAIAFNSDFIKAGAPARSDRNAKYNRVLEIDQENKGILYYKGVEAYKLHI